MSRTYRYRTKNNNLNICGLNEAFYYYGATKPNKAFIRSYEHIINDRPRYKSYKIWMKKKNGNRRAKAKDTFIRYFYSGRIDDL